MGLRVSESVVRDHLGLPDPGDDERILQAPQGAPPPPTAPVEDPAGAANRRRAMNAEEGGVDTLDQLEALASGRWERILPSMLQPAAELVHGANSLEAIREGLVDLVQRMPVEDLQEMVARSTFTARLAGNTGARIG